MKVAATASGHFRSDRQAAHRPAARGRLLRDFRLRAPLRLVGQIDVFQPRLDVRRHDLRFELVVELALLADRIEDRGAALLQFAQIAEPLLERAQLRVVEHAGRFLAVARDERHRRAAVQKLDRRLHLLRPHAKLFRNPLFDGFHQSPLHFMMPAVAKASANSSRDHTGRRRRKTNDHEIVPAVRPHQSALSSASVTAFGFFAITLR